MKTLQSLLFILYYKKLLLNWMGEWMCGWIKLDVEECGEVLMAAWGVMDSSRVQQGEGFIAPQLLAALFLTLGENLSVHSKVWLLLNFGKASCSRMLYLCAHTRHIQGMKLLIDLCQSRSCFCTSSCFGSLIVGGFFVAVVFFCTSLWLSYDFLASVGEESSDAQGPGFSLKNVT